MINCVNNKRVQPQDLLKAGDKISSARWNGPVDSLTIITKIERVTAMR